MRYIVEKNLADFEFWGSADENANMLTLSQLETIEEELEVLYPEGLTETEINDLFRFDFDFICQILGYEDEEALQKSLNTCEA